ncbi:hypothetical protein CASFOL_036787 [Castilleja foliolosa]|uniref:Dirigent protein n=1 Tax=Castilleja foliolosa TaxID=1961234 RepID=A0ABD3BR82_9LAMI
MTTIIKLLVPKTNQKMNNLVMITKLFLIFLLTIISCSSSVKSLKRNKPCNQMVLYYHDILFNGTNQANATSAVTANDTALALLSDGHFGRMIVFDDPVTKDNHLLSEPVARAQGFYFYNKKDGYDAWFAFTMVFNSTEHKGTMTIMGADIMLAKTRDFSVVSGTGDYLMAKGICTVSTDERQGDYYFRLKMDIKLYECY